MYFCPLVSVLAPMYGSRAFAEFLPNMRSQGVMKSPSIPIFSVLNRLSLSTGTPQVRSSFPFMIFSPFATGFNTGYSTIAFPLRFKGGVRGSPCSTSLLWNILACALRYAGHKMSFQDPAKMPPLVDRAVGGGVLNTDMSHKATRTSGGFIR